MPNGEDNTDTASSVVAYRRERSFRNQMLSVVVHIHLTPKADADTTGLRPHLELELHRTKGSRRLIPGAMQTQ
jgi:hypothetical protein